MAKKTPKKQGRPIADNPKRVLISFRVDDVVAAAIEHQREKMGILSFSISDTVREVLLRTLKEGGLL